MKKEKGTFGWVFIFAGQKKSGYIASVIFAVIGAAFQILPFFVMAQVIGKLLAGNKDLAGYLIDCAVMAAFWLLRVLLHSLSTAQSHKATFAVLGNIRKQGLAKLAKMPLGDVQAKGSGELKNILVERVDSIEPTLAHAIPEMSSNAAVALATLIYLFVIDWRMALASLITFPLGMVFFMLMMAGYEKNYARTVAATNTLNDTAVEYIGGIEVIKAFNQGKNSYAKFTDRVKANASYFYHWMKSCQMPVSLARAISPTTMITILPVGWLLYTGGSLPIETFITTIVLPLGIAGPLLAAMDFVDSLAKVGTIVGSVDAILNGAEQDHGETPAEFQGRGIQLSHVSFGYHADKEVLHDVSLTIPAGTMTAFVGPSGSGKSTIAKLIAGFWDVTSGAITLGGQDLNRVPLKQLYDQVAFVSQDNYLFDESIRENIRMGRPAATDAEVEAVAKAAGCDAFIRSLEHGYDTVVGGGGAHLSGGERQRIAIARAMLKDAPIVVLDEATAYIDPENEAVVQQAVGKLVAGKTVLVIAHRLSTITGADQIVVVNGGRSQDVGTHGELLKNCPLYQEMWRAHMGAKEGEQA